MLSPALTSSKKTDWATPRDLFERLDYHYRFNLDAAASDENALCDAYFTKEDAHSCFDHDWVVSGTVSHHANQGRVFLNPPYGRQTGAFLQRAIDEVSQGNAIFVVALLPARPDTRWWIKGVRDTTLAHVEFLPGRLRFEGAEHSAPFPSAIVEYRLPWKEF